MASRNFDTKQALERQLKSLYLKTTYTPTAATLKLPTTAPIYLTKVALNSLQNATTFKLAIAAAAANTSDQVIAVWTGSAAATVLTITPNNGTNNPTTQAFGSLATTTPIVLTKTVAAKGGVLGNTCTFTTIVNAPAANAGGKILVTIAGTAAAITCTITPDSAPLDLTTAGLVTLINSGAHTDVTLTNVGGLLNDQTATGGGVEIFVDSGMGDGTICTFAGGVNTAVSLTTAEVVELIMTDVVAGKTLAVTDTSNLSALATATGGGAQLVVDAGEGDLAVLAFSGATDFVNDNSYGFYSVGLTATGLIRVYLEDKFYALRFVDGIIIDATARDFTIQVKAYDINPTSGRAYVDIFTLTGGSATALPASAKLDLEFVVRNTSAM